MNGARYEYYTNLIAENSSNQQKLFCTTKLLLCEPSQVLFPKDVAPDDLANDFGNFFMQKIDKINQLIDMLICRALWRCHKPEKRELSEKAAANQLSDHMTTNDLHMPLQSVYKQNHSTLSETTLP